MSSPTLSTTSAVSICRPEAGCPIIRNPAFLDFPDGSAWPLFGAAGAHCLWHRRPVDEEAKINGILGGLIGGRHRRHDLDPYHYAPCIAASLSRAVGFALFGAATGAAMGWVSESGSQRPLLYVTSARSAGKPVHSLQNRSPQWQRTKIRHYLFKDPSILGQHAAIAISGSRVQMKALALPT